MFVRTAIALVAAVSIGALLAGAAQPGHEGHHAPKGTQPAPQPARAINDRCPIQGGEVDPETAMRVWRGHCIGFCCPGCETKWDAKPDAEKDAFLGKFVKVGPASPAVDLARRFHAARAAGDTSALDRLFLSGGRATVLQNGSDAGTWERYREEYLKPELKVFGTSTWRKVTEAESPLGTATLVRQTVTFTAGEGAKKKVLSVAVTLVIVDHGGTLKIAHMHWSSRDTTSDRK
ncbi:MAG: nuclear transport factor 2 family protein [Phycisphaerae bacterium]|nr:nuclear transport factor 2 family protein [Phycisphaerae bacterium]